MKGIARANRKNNKTNSSQQQRVIRTDKDLDRSEYNTVPNVSAYRPDNLFQTVIGVLGLL